MLRRIHQRLVQFFQRLLDLRQRRLQVLGGRVETFEDALRQRARRKQLAEFFRSGKKVGQLELVAVEQLGLAGFNQRGENARKDRRNAAGELAVNNFNLREVGDLRRPAAITQRGQQVILHHRTQQHVGAEALRTSLGLRRNLRRAESALADKKVCVLVTHRGAHSIFKVKTERV